MDTHSLWSVLDRMLPNYAETPLSYWGMYVLAGIFGSLVRISYLDKPLRGFYRDARGNLRMGFFAEVVVGIAVAMIVDGHPIRAGVAAIFAPHILGLLRTFLVSGLQTVLDVQKKR